MRYKAKCLFAGFWAIVLFFLAGLCLWTRTSQVTFPTDKAVLAAAALTLPDGDYKLLNVSYDNTDGTDGVSDGTTTSNSSAPFDATHDESVYMEDPSLYDGEDHYPVVETLYADGDNGYNDIYVKNSTDFNLDIKEFIDAPLGFEFEQNNKIQVLIYHTHTSESYINYDAGYYHRSFYPRSSDNSRNMVRVGEAIAQGLREKGVGVVHATESHDDPQYTGAYGRSRSTIEKYLEMYPDIKVILDIHRDSISYGSNNGKIKPTFTYNGNKAAQIMIMSGYDPDGSKDFPFWEENLSFALKLQSTAEQMYPGMTRPLYFGNFAYNMNVNNGSLLIEVGTDVNTLSEAVYTGELLSNVLAKVLQRG